MPNIFIVVKINFQRNIDFIESVWNTEELAESARLYHANRAVRPTTDYQIIERELNAAHYDK
jgi:hypothetical protein